VLTLIIFKQGNLFNDFDKVEAIINTVNCVGVMGKGVAKEFSNRFPKLLKEYKLKCSIKELDIGRNFVYEIPNYGKTKYIVNFPTKKHWRNDSKLEYIEKGLNHLVTVINDFQIKSIVMPALGCGNGNLEWEVVKPLIVNKLSHLTEVEIIIYEPALKDLLNDNALALYVDKICVIGKDNFDTKNYSTLFESPYLQIVSVHVDKKNCIISFNKASLYKRKLKVNWLDINGKPICNYTEEDFTLPNPTQPFNMLDFLKNHEQVRVTVELDSSLVYSNLFNI